MSSNPVPNDDGLGVAALGVAALGVAAKPTERRPPRRTALLLRVVAVLHAALLVVQPIAIGQYLDGRYGALTVHSIVGSTLMFPGMLLAGAAVAYVIAGGRRIALIAVLFLFGEVGQVAAGYTRALAVHIPLGVALIVSAILFTCWTLRRSVSR